VSFKYLAVLPFLVATAPVVITLLLDGKTQDAALDIEVETVKIFALAGSLAAASAFDRGDYLRRAWLVHGFCYVFLLLRDLLFTVWFDHYGDGAAAQYLEPVLVILANACGVIGVWMLSRTWEVAGIALPWSPGQRLLVRTLGVVVGIAIAGPTLYLEIGHALQGKVLSIVLVISGIADVLSLALIVPVMLTALALRGGLLLWPWGLFTAGALSWLLYDFTGLMRHLAHIEPDTAKMWREFFRAMACTFCLSTGIAQRWVSNAESDLKPAAPARAA
jgi:hypothetical protein